jgi:hypothetical protein
MAPIAGPAAAFDPPNLDGTELWALVGAVVKIVTFTVLAVLPAGVTVAGEKLHADSLGKPEHANATCCLKPFVGVKLSVAVALLPGCIDSFTGLTLNEKPGMLSPEVEL